MSTFPKIPKIIKKNYINSLFRKRLHNNIIRRKSLKKITTFIQKNIHNYRNYKLYKYELEKAKVIISLAIEYDSIFTNYLKLTQSQQKIFIQIALENLDAYQVLLTMSYAEQKFLINTILELPVNKQYNQIKSLANF